MLTPDYGIAVDKIDSPLPGEVAPSDELGWGYDSAELRRVLDRISFADTTLRLRPCVTDSKGREYWGKADIVIQRDGAVSYAPAQLPSKVWVALGVVLPIILSGMAIATLAVVVLSRANGSS